LKDFKANETEAIMLHSRKYRETSLICELFTKKIGRVSVIAKGARSKKNKFQNITSPNVLANINFSGRSELRTLTAWEELSYFQILGKNLRVLLYLNELIYKLLERENKQEKIFNGVINLYKTLAASDAKNIELSLREFEYFLICELGYGFDIFYDDKGSKLEKEKTYYFHPALGFTLNSSNNFLKASGIDIINFSKGKIVTNSARSIIKKIMQLAISNIAERPMNAGIIFND
jgi:DNA repair protein RecO (recombination protein O)|tara:strand:+ start:72 stop:770 length:699 start_codon:yes stop_codon:yes gene_type:complete